MVFNIVNIRKDGLNMITAAQLRAARALLGMDQRQLADLSGLSVPTIQRMEASDGVIRGNVDSLMKLTAGLDSAGIELIGEGAVSQPGGRGVRMMTPRESAQPRRDGEAAVQPQAE
jgi:transcriptional regulator with XRE-family HTH domain